MPRGPMAKHPSARRRTNAPATTAREIVLRSPDEPLLPVPPLPPRRKTLERGADPVEVEWHDSAKIAWVELWQFPLVYQAPTVDHHLLYVYIAAIDEFWSRLEAGRSVTELMNQIKLLSEQWGVGEKARRHLQITIAEAEEAMRQGAKRQPVNAEIQAPVPTQLTYTPDWADDDEDIAEAEVVG